MPRMQGWLRQNLRLSRWTNASSAGDALSLTQTHYVLRPTRVPSLEMETTKRMAFVNARGEAKRFRFCGGGYNGWGPDARLSSVREGIRRKTPIAKTTAASVLGSRGVVGTAGRAGLGGSVPVLILDGWVTLYLEWWTNSSRVTTSISSLFSERNLYTS